MKKLVEFKIERDDLAWEQTPVAFTLDLSHLSFDAVQEYCDELSVALALTEHAIIRWERQGVGQGHYMSVAVAEGIREDQREAAGWSLA